MNTALISLHFRAEIPCFCLRLSAVISVKNILIAHRFHGSQNFFSMDNKIYLW